MGLTIHYTLTAPPGTDAAHARKLVEALRRQALGFRQRGRVDAVGPSSGDVETLRWATVWRFLPVANLPHRQWEIEVTPLSGSLFAVGVGRDCEPLWLGLCRYPSRVVVAGERRRTGLSGWRLKSFCKTQFASLHGWEHFRRCHTAVIDLLAVAKSSGWRVEIQDEGDYWPGRDVAALRRSLDEMNGVVAAAAGVLKDWSEAVGGAPVQSPILAHPHFERLEAEGAARGHATRLRKVLQ